MFVLCQQYDLTPYYAFFIAVKIDLGVPNSVLFQGEFSFQEFHSKFLVEIDAPKNSRDFFLSGFPEAVASAREYLDDFISQTQGKKRKVRKELNLGSPSVVYLFELYLKREVSFFF